MADRSDLRRLASRQALGARIREGDSYSLLLAAILVTYAAMAVLGESAWARTIEGACFGGVLLLALHTSHVRGRAIVVAAVVVVGWTLFNVLQSLLGEAFQGSGALVTVLIVVAPMVVLVRIMRHPQVNVETILGAICAYLLIGIAFAALYRMLNSIDSVPFFAQGATTDPVKYLYFSFIVLTTVGLGDLSPRTDAGRILVSFEALIGQVFLVVLLANLVGNVGRFRLRSSDASPAPDDASGTADHGDGHDPPAAG